MSDAIQTWPGCNAELVGDNLYGKAVMVAKAANPPSIANLQRTLRIGYNRAKRMMDRMIDDGVIEAFLLENGIRYRVVTNASRGKKMAADATVNAIEFALRTDGGIEFLRCWMVGDFAAIREEWPDAPESVFIGADPLMVPSDPIVRGAIAVEREALEGPMWEAFRHRYSPGNPAMADELEAFPKLKAAWEEWCVAWMAGAVSEREACEGV